jgi:hypothetical protein
VASLGCFLEKLNDIDAKVTFRFARHFVRRKICHTTIIQEGWQGANKKARENRA